MIESTGAAGKKSVAKISQKLPVAMDKEVFIDKLSALYDAIHGMDIENVASLVKERINCSNARVISPLILAISLALTSKGKDRIAVVETILANLELPATEVNGVATFKLPIQDILVECTPLQAAVAENNLALVKLLIKYHANPLVRGMSKWTAIEWAEQAKAKKSIKKLLVRACGKYLVDVPLVVSTE